MKSLKSFIYEKLIITKNNGKNFESGYFYVEPLENNFTFKFGNNTVGRSGKPTNYYYSIDECETWNEIPNQKAEFEFNNISAHNKIYFKSDGNGTKDGVKFSSGNPGWSGVCTIGYIKQKFNVGGNIMSLLYGDDFQNKTSFEGSKKGGQFAQMFFRSEGLTSAEDLILPATDLTKGCYCEMFIGCKSLVNGPELPAIKLAEDCYHGMFSACESLAEGPELPAEKLAKSCYCFMFNKCRSLKSMTVHAQYIKPKWCIFGMFSSAENLQELKIKKGVKYDPSELYLPDTTKIIEI